jgi:hypothetical protein
MASLEENIKRAIDDFDNIQNAIEEQGVPVPYGTDTSEYGKLVRGLVASKTELLTEQVNTLQQEKAELEKQLSSKIDTSRITNFQYFCGFNRFTDDDMSKIDVRSAANISSMFQGSNQITKVPSGLNACKGTNFSFVFFGCYNLLEIPELDTSNATNIREMFEDCRKVTEIPKLNTDKVKSFFGAFASCYALKKLSVTYIGGTDVTNMFNNSREITTINVDRIKVSNNNLAFNYCTKLTVESLMNIINAFDDNSDLETTYKVYFGTTNLAKLTKEQIKIATDKNIELY